MSSWGTREPVPPAPLRVAPLRARTGTRECPGTQHKHCLPCICAAVCPQFDTSLLVITAGMVAGLSRPRRVGEGSTLDDFAVSALRRAAQPKTKRARTDGQEAHDVALARDGRLGEAAAAAVAVADGARTLSSKRRARGPVEGITQEYLAHAVNHTCHRDFENCKFLHTGVTKDPRGVGQEDEGGAGGSRTSVVFVERWLGSER